MDIEKAKELSELANHQISLAQRYEKERSLAGTAKLELELVLVSKLKAIRAQKKNVGYDMAILILLEDSDVARNLYKAMCLHTDNYKGLEKLIEAHQSKISLEQSVMKYIGQGEKYGG